MCGIAGYCGSASNFDESALQRMLWAIHHRGPDDSGSYTACFAGSGKNRVWLGSRRLAIQDLSPAGHQPMVDLATRNAIAFNGEIYNFLELREQLQRRGHHFESRCDTEVALRSWCVNGDMAFESWRGMFGTALWNHNRSELVLVRDQWGIKPLYYWTDGEGILFCSEVRGLLASGLVPRKLSRRGMQDFLHFGSVQDPVTLIHDVHALLPGHVLRWKQRQIEIAPYSEASFEGEPGQEKLDDILREIVRQQLISDVPVGVFLSGGIDSSVLALLARQEAGKRVNTISLAFAETNFSEGGYARAVANHIGTQHHEVILKAEEIRAKAIEAIENMDQPSVDGINSYTVCEAAKRLGFRVALSGLGGDEFFGGYRTFRHIRQMAALRYCASRAPWFAKLAAIAATPLAARAGSAPLKVAEILQHDDFHQHLYLAERSLLFPSQVAEFRLRGSASSAAEISAEARLQSIFESASRYDRLNQVSFLEARLYMANTLLRDSDQMSMAHSVELRVPFVDQRLAAYLLAVPGKQKGFGKTQKLWLRSAYESYLPKEVFHRRKMGFTLPFKEWLKGPLASEVEHTLAASTDGLWHEKAALHVWRRFQSGRAHWTQPWALYALRKWIAANVEIAYSEPESDSRTISAEIAVGTQN